MTFESGTRNSVAEGEIALNSVASAGVSGRGGEGLVGLMRPTFERGISGRGASDGFFEQPLRDAAHRGVHDRAAAAGVAVPAGRLLTRVLTPLPSQHQIQGAADMDGANRQRDGLLGVEEDHSPRPGRAQRPRAEPQPRADHRLRPGQAHGFGERTVLSERREDAGAFCATILPAAPRALLGRELVSKRSAHEHLFQLRLCNFR